MAYSWGSPDVARTAALRTAKAPSIRRTWVLLTIGTRAGYEPSERRSGARPSATNPAGPGKCRSIAPRLTHSLGEGSRERMVVEVGSRHVSLGRWKGGPLIVSRGLAVVLTAFVGLTACATPTGTSGSPSSAEPALAAVATASTRPAAPAGTTPPAPAAQASATARPADPTAATAAPVAAFSVTITRAVYGSVSARTAPGARCSASARLPSGRTSTAAGLDTHDADSAGNITWNYRTVSNTTKGTGSYTVSCSLAGRTASATAPFRVE